MKGGQLSLHRTLVVVGVMLLTVQFLKLAGVLSAIRWIVANGEDFSTALKTREGEFSEAVYWELLDRTRGQRVFPFGVLEYRLLRYAKGRNSLSRTALMFGRFVLYDFVAIGLAVMLYLFFAGTPKIEHEAGGSVTWIAWASGSLAAVQLVAIYAEACVSYAKIGSYGLGWHGASRYAEKQSNGAYLTEIGTLAGAVVYSLGIGCMIFYFAAGNGAEFGALTVARTSPWGIVSDLLNCLYYSLVTFFTADTPDPVNGPARLATAIPVVQAVCALILAFSTATMYMSAESRSAPAKADTAHPEAGEEPPRKEEVSRPPVDTSASRRTGFIGGLIAGAALVAAITTARERKQRDRR